MTTSEAVSNYKQLDLKSQILHRPDTYVGSKNNVTQNEYIFKDNLIQLENVEYNEALVRLFIEVLCNSIDNVWRSKEKNIEQKIINIDIIDKQWIEISNDGCCIPIEMTKDKDNNDVYVPELIFGNLLSSSNYNDEKDRKTSGKNGIGIKLTNIFSKHFEVIIKNKDSQKEYKQIWKDNMSIINKPSIKDKTIKNNLVTIKYLADFKIFNCHKYSDDIISHFTKLVYDASLNSEINIKLNGEKIGIKNILDYIKNYYVFNNDDKNIFDTKEFIEIKTNDTLLILLPNYNKDFDTTPIPFVNGIFTFEGGVHVNEFENIIYKYLSDKLSKKNNSFNIKDIKNFFKIFIKCSLDKPTFNSQLKSKLTSPKPDTRFDTKILDKIMKWDIIDEIKNFNDFKQDAQLKKNLNSKRKFCKIPNYDFANKSGGKDSDKCVLLLVEGLSAKTFATKGIKYGINGISGRDYCGIYPLKGKLLNVRNATNEQILKNKEISDLIQILNLKTGVDYTIDSNFKTLNYGRIITLTDADNDGGHIKGLLLNVFDVLFTTLLKRKNNFITSMLTPIITVKEKGKTKAFFDEYEANDYILQNNVSNVKYYKGLGTSNDNDIKENFGKKIIMLDYDKETDSNMNKAFNSKKGFSDDRKEWITNYEKKYIDYSQDKMSISTFINDELIRFSISDNKRSLPHVIDGLKESQRKILYAVFLKGLKYNGSSMKVAQLGAFAAEKTNYAHGENSLFETIIKMAQDFVGSNNINLLFPDGQFGSRIASGSDSASPRYIFTKLNKYTEYIFNKLDEPLFTQKIEDGDKVEFEHYCPIIPMILVNGAIGIGTGFSCNIPSYNPLDIIAYIKIWLKNKNLQKQKELTPWYNNFKGTIKYIEDGKYETYGIKKELDKNKIEIIELPIGISIDSFKEKLDDALEKKYITSYQNHSTTEEPNFIIKYSEINPNLQKIFELKSCISTSNMTCFDKDDKIKKYDSVNDIIEEFCSVRLEYYIKRKEYLLKQYEQDLLTNSNKYRFINSIINDEINIYKKTEKESIIILENNNFDKIPDNSSNGYNYLLNMSIKSFTKDKLDELKKIIDSLKKQIKELKLLTPETLWENNLNEFEKVYS